MNKHPKFQKKGYLKKNWGDTLFRQKKHSKPRKIYQSNINYFDKQTSLLENGSLDDLK